jgi:hypothetical protein
MRALLITAIVLVACGGEEEAAPASAARGPFRGPVHVAAPSTTTAATPVSVGRHDYHPLTTTRPSGSIAAPSTATGASTPTTTARATERDLGAELGAAIGSPTSCIDTETARTLHGHLAISVSANVTPTGSVTRATASGGLPPAALECIRTRALGAHIAPPIEGAPRTVTASLAFDVTTTDDVTTRVTPVWHQPGQIVEPGIVTPAIGAEGRPAGSVPPDITQPAVGAQGRPEGSVPPDIITPARGGSGTMWPSGAPPDPPTSVIVH